MTQIVKHIYEKPTMMVVKLENRHHLLESSPTEPPIPIDDDTTLEQW